MMVVWVSCRFRLPIDPFFIVLMTLDKGYAFDVLSVVLQDVEFDLFSSTLIDFVIVLLLGATNDVYLHSTGAGGDDVRTVPVIH